MQFGSFEPGSVGSSGRVTLPPLPAAASRGAEKPPPAPNASPAKPPAVPGGAEAKLSKSGRRRARRKKQEPAQPGLTLVKGKEHLPLHRPLTQEEEDYLLAKALQEAPEEEQLTADEDSASVPEEADEAPQVTAPRRPTQPAAKLPLVTRVPCHFSLNQQQSRALTEMFPGLVFEPTAPLSAHKHPVGAICRAQGERNMYERLLDLGAKVIVDVGGNPNRHKRRPEVWCQSPSLGPQDAWRRVRDLAGGEGLRYCEHRFQDCECDAQRNAEAYMLVHSLYYLTPGDVVAMLRRCVDGRRATVLALVHRFPDPEGYLDNSEAYYVSSVRENTRWVTMTVNGNNHPYEHSALDWLETRRSIMVEEGLHLVWTQLESVGDSVILAFNLFEGHVADDRAPTTSWDMLKNATYEGMVDIRPAARILQADSASAQLRAELLTMRDAPFSLYSLGRLLGITVGKAEPVIVPKGVIAEVAGAIAGRPRTAECGKQALQLTRTLMKNVRGSPEKLARVIPYVAYAALTLTLEDELIAHRSFSLTFASSLAAHDLINPNKLDRAVSWVDWAWMNRLPILAGVGVALFGLGYVRRPVEEAITTMGAGAMMALRFPAAVGRSALRGFGHGVAAVARFPYQMGRIASVAPASVDGAIGLYGHRSLMSTAWYALCEEVFKCVVSRSAAWPVAFSLPIIELGAWGWSAVPAALFHAASIYIYRTNPFPKTAILSLTAFHVSFNRLVTSAQADAFPAAEVIVKQDVCFRYMAVPDISEESYVSPMPATECRAAPATQLEGPALLECQPIYPRSCVHNEMNALANRVCLAKTDDEAEWPHVQAIFDELHEMGLLPTVVEPTDPTEWSARYPLNRRIAVRHEANEADADLDVLAAGGRVSTLTKFFPKWEALLKENSSGVFDTKVRGIQGKTDSYLSVVGPYMHAYGNALKAIWHKKSPIYYTSGATAEDLGQWLELAIATLGPDVSQVHLVECDASVFDGSQSQGALDTEAMQYRRTTPKISKQMDRLIRSQRRTRGRTIHGLRYRAIGRESGVPNTSCGNSLLNVGYQLRALAKTYARYTGRPACVKDMLRNAWVMILGDDAVLIIRRSFCAPPTPADYAACGLRAKVFVRPSIIATEYCSGRFYLTNTGRVWGPKIARAVAKCMWRDLTSDLTAEEWIDAVLTGNRDMVFVPVFGDMIRSLLAHHSPPGRLIALMQRTRADRVHEAVDETWEELAELYGLNVDDLRDEADRLSSPEPKLHSSWALDMMIAVDCPISGKVDSRHIMTRLDEPRRVQRRAEVMPYKTGPVITPASLVLAMPRKNAAKKAARSQPQTRDLATVAAMVPTMVATLDRVGHAVFGANGQKKAKSKSAQPRKSVTGMRSDRSAPVNVATSMKPSFNTVRTRDGARVTGTDFLATVTLNSAADNVPGAFLFDLMLNPLTFEDTRLAQMAPLFRRFKFRKFNMVFLPSQGTNTSGTIIMAYSHDAESEPAASGNTTVAQIMSWNDSISGSLFQPLMMKSTQKTPTEPYYTNLNNSDSERHNFQGQAVMVLQNSVTVLTGSAVSYPAVLGTVWVDYEIDLYDEQLNPSLLTSAASWKTTVTITPSTAVLAGWNKILDPSSVAFVKTGDYSNFQPAQDSTGQWYLNMPRGIWMVTQRASYNNSGFQVGVICGWNVMSCAANNASEGGVFGEQAVGGFTDRNSGPTASTTVNLTGDRTTLIVIPDGGGKLYGNWAGSNLTNIGGNLLTLELIVVQVDQSLLTILSPPSLASSNVRCGRAAHPRLEPHTSATCRILGCAKGCTVATDAAPTVPIGGLPIPCNITR